MIKNPYIVFIDNTLNQNNLNMPIAVAILAAKAGCVLVGSLVHEATKFVTSLGADHKDTARGLPCLLIEDQQLGQDTPNPKESPCDALILYASREVVPSSKSRALVTLPNDSLTVGSRCDLTDSNLLSTANSLDFFADWYGLLARFIALVHALVQSALRSVVSDMKVSFASFFASVSKSAVQRKQVACIAFLIQVYFTRFMAKVFVILKEAVRLLKSRIEEKISMLLGTLFPAGIDGRRYALLTDSTSVDDSLTQKYLAMVISFVKQLVVAMFPNTSTGLRSMRLHATKVMTFVLLVCGSISLIGWNIPLVVFDGSNIDQYLLQPALEVEAGPFSSVPSPSVGTSNSPNLTESFVSFDGIGYVSMNMGTDRQVVSNHIDFPGLHWPANDFSAASTAALSYVSWNVDESYVQSRSESLPHINVLELPSEDHTSNGIATEYSGGCIVSAATADAAFMTQSISQAPHQSFVELETSPSLNAADGDTSTKLVIIIVVGPPQELFTINYLLKFDGCFDSMQVNDRYSSMAVRMHDALTDFDHPVLIAYDRGSYLYVWSENDFITVLLSESHTSFIWDHDAAAIIPLDENIGAIHSIQSESSLFYASGDLSSDRYATSHLSADLDSPSLGLNHSLPSSMQMIVTELGPPQELPTIQNRQFGRSLTQNATIYPQLMLPAPSDRTSSFEMVETSVTMKHSRRFSSVQSSLTFSALKESYSCLIFGELRQIALLLLMLVYHNSDGNTNEPDDVALSSGSVTPTSADLELEEVSDDEVISSAGENEEDFVLSGDTNTIKPSRRELMALRSELGSHWNSPSKRRMRRSPRTRSRPQYFQPT